MAAPKILTPSEAEQILQKNVSNIVKKAASGKPLSAREQHLISQFTDAKSDLCPPTSDIWLPSYAALGKQVGLHRASFPRIRRDYPDAPKPRSNGDHNLAAWRTFLSQHAEIHCKSPASVSASEQAIAGPTKSELELRKLLRQCLDLEFDYAAKEKKYILTADAIRWASEMVGEFVKVLDAIPGSLAPDIIGLPNIVEAERRIRAALENAKATLHSSPWGKE